MGSKFIQVTNLFFFCCTSDLLSVKMLKKLDTLYVNNQMVVLCTTFCFDFIIVLLIEEKNVYCEGIKS